LLYDAAVSRNTILERMRFSDNVFIVGLTGLIVGYVIGARRRHKSDLPVGVGNREAQQRFIRGQAAFLREFPHIHALLTKTFIRALFRPSEEEVAHLPDGDPAVVAFENKIIANRLVFYLGRTAADDFGELLILSGNGYGVGALKILRGMYERIVTAAYIAKNPSEARVFAEDDTIKKWKLWQEYVTVMPELRTRYTDEQVRELEERYKAIRAKRKEDTCPRCGQPKTQEAWTRVTMPDMAKRADIGLAEICGSCYLEPTFHSHATAYGIGTRLRETEEGGYTFNETTEQEARRAVLLGHNLILRLLGLQSEYFGLGLEAEIRDRISMFPKIWGSGTEAGEGRVD
jgi:hypothetical protein